jgi:predicted DNA-binding transcriptional regulator YafY
LHSVVIAKGRLNAFKQLLKHCGPRIDRAEEAPNDGEPAQWAARWLENHNGHEAREEPAKDTAPEPGPEDAIALPSYSPRIVGEIIDDAIRRRRPLLIQYQSAWSAMPTLRRVNPVSLDLIGSAPSFSGYCHRLGAAREFRLARITGIRVLDNETF